MLDGPRPNAVDVIFDLRQFDREINGTGGMQALWNQIADMLIGRQLIRGQPLSLQLPQGLLKLWVVETHALTHVASDTTFDAIDVLRNPRLFYRCRVCGEYGPLRCGKCEVEKRAERLCARATCSHFIKDELSAYCPDHIPNCSCQAECHQNAVFRCRRCRKLYGAHSCRQNPKDPEVDYCLRCYQVLFELCEACKAQGRSRLGRSKCTFKSRSASEACARPLCWNHSYQWKIWGPHNRGITLCEHHKKLLGASEPADLLFMMMTSRPPYARRGRRHSLPNPFRLRRIINTNRLMPLGFDGIGQIIGNLSDQAVGWGSLANKNYDYLAKTFHETVSRLPQVEADLLSRVRAFYQSAVGWDAAARINGLEITDRFSKPGQPACYRVKLHLSTSNKGAYIGRGGSTINLLRSQLNILVDLD